MRRVGTIALVHNLLSQTIDEEVEFDDMLGRALRLAADIASADTYVRTVSTGSFGKVSAEDATALALILTELVTNAVEHGFVGRSSGTVTIDAQREGAHLVVRIADDGVSGSRAAPPRGPGLGTQIVRTLVANELRGSIDWHGRPEGGTEVVVSA